MNKRTRELNGPLGAADYQSGLLSDFVPSLSFFFYHVTVFKVGVRLKTSPGAQCAVELAVSGSDGGFTNPISKILSDFKNESHFYFTPIRHLPVSLEVKVPPIIAQRH